MKTGTKVAIGAGVAALLVGGVAFAASRKKRGQLLGSADGATKNRIGDIQDAVWDAMQNGQMRELAIALTSRGDRQITLGRRTFKVKGANCPPRDGRCEADVVTRWVSQHDNIAREAMDVGCDSSAAMVCSLVSLNGVTCHLRAARRDDGQTYIYSLAGLPKLQPTSWSAVDAASGEYAFGRELKKRDFEDFDG